MYKYIIFDIGGVMVEWNPKDYLMERFAHLETEEKVYDLTFGSQTWRDLDAGILTRYQGNQKMLEEAKKAGLLFEVKEVLDDWKTILRPKHKMIEYVKELKEHGYMVYYLSNIPKDTLEYLMANTLKGLFDGGVASYEVQVNKPDTRIYRALLKRYRLRAKEGIFIDDNLENVEAAFNVGITGIQMKGNVGTLIRNLATCNVR